MQLNISGVITKGVSSGIESTLQKIQDDIEQEKIKISNVNILILQLEFQRNFKNSSFLCNHIHPRNSKLKKGDENHSKIKKN